MKTFILYFLLPLILTSCSKPQKLVGGACEGCEAVFEYGEKILSPADTIPGFYEGGTQIKLGGVIYQNDGKTPAGDVIMYIYHTDTSGVYPVRGDETNWGRRHGYMRGWIKTRSNGKYTFYTIRPGSYPDSRNPAHIHAIILEPDGKYYWIFDFLFSDDPFLTNRESAAENPRGGNGILRLKEEGGIMTGTRNIILGENVPGY